MIKRLGDICSFISGYAWKSSEFTSEGIPIIRINNMHNDITEFVYWKGDYDKKYMIHSGDLLVSLSGSIKPFLWQGPAALLNQRIAKITANTETNQQWIYYQITYAIKQIASKAKHAVVKNLSVEELKNFEVDIPEFELQNKIVSVLDKVNSILSKRNYTLKLLNELLFAKYMDMFSSKNPGYKTWKEVEIKNLVSKDKGSLRTGPFGSSLKHDEFTDEGEVAVLGIDNAVNNEFQWDKKRFITKKRYNTNFKRYTVLPDDVIVTIMGTVGRAAVIPKNIPLAINTKHLACITLDKKNCNPYYLAYSLHSGPFVSHQMKSKHRGVIMEGLNLDIIKHLKLKKAPISEQNKFEAIYHSIKAKEYIVKNSTHLLTELYNSLMQQAFTGRLKLDVAVELDALLKVLDLRKSSNDIISIATNEEYLLNLVSRLNSQNFDNQELYDKAKHAAYQLLKEDENLVQKYDRSTKSIKLFLR